MLHISRTPISAAIACAKVSLFECGQGPLLRDRDMRFVSNPMQQLTSVEWSPSKAMPRPCASNNIALYGRCTGGADTVGPMRVIARDTEKNSYPHGVRAKPNPETMPGFGTVPIDSRGQPV